MFFVGVFCRVVGLVSDCDGEDTLFYGELSVVLRTFKLDFYYVTSERIYADSARKYN
jgi:hypothetical protein